MKIAIFTDTFAPEVNGVAKTLKRFTEYLDEQGIEYRVFAPKSSNEGLYSSNVHRFASLPFFLYQECRLALPKMSNVREELQQFQPDIIHVATPFNMGLCGLHYAKKLNIPIVGSYHTDFDKYLTYYDMQFLSKVLWKYMHWFHRPLKKIFVPSTDTKEQLQKHGFTNLSIWSRGVDVSTYHSNYNEQRVREKYQIKEKHLLLYVGRISPEKDVNLLPDISERLLQKGIGNVHWLIVGDGPLKSELEDAAPTNMTFAGYITGEDLAEIYAAADLFVFPSATETFGNVVLESMACGTPVIGVNAGGVRTIINDGVTGILCEEKDNEAFAEAIIRMLSDRVERETMRLEVKKYAKTQAWDTIFDGLLDEYEQVLQESGYRVLA
ncbi:glycosyltransferase family 4 protein [Oceanobacillus polygoni]|uniref:Glycosyltransferase involved in cell wall biosynthesis n=1 Tax=Oceanobacillus polygoni TaxID=1235259 RepID=A0A9X0YRX4_9BACI|nr:glycosyltransferase family 1 protein [Oceanobacillus polygoni]MBP2076927.1 glycosyltransferase involved in cell wall biosynthesis [Oceanobacillus polygoni]